LKKITFIAIAMHTLFKQYLNINAPFSDTVLDETIQHFILKKAKKGTLLQLAGDTCGHLYFINKGCARTYYITRQGQEKTRYIAFEGSICTPLAAFISQQPSFEFMDVLENSELLYISYTDFYQLAKQYPAWQAFYIKLLEQAYLFQNRKIETLTTLTAKQRYNALLEKQPVFVQRIPNKVLASYLSITQETLSRLKSQV